MSVFYSESNDESTIDLYRKRLIYHGRLIERYGREYFNFTDFNRGEKFFYGRVNRLFVPISYNNGIALKAFNSTNSPELGFQAANFVVDAFEALAQQFEKCTLTGKISPADRFLSNLRVYKAYQKPDVLYGNHIQTHFNAIADALRAKNVKVKDFGEFMRELSTLLIKSAHTVPFTQTAYMKSRRCSILSTGLALEIADLDVTNDEEKITQFIESPNWEFYLNACRSYGFMVDRAVPWRLVADIGSSHMLKYATVYGIPSTNAVLSRGYRPTHLKYFENFRFWLLQLYNQVKLPLFSIREDCQGVTVSKTIVPQTYSMDELTQTYSTVYFLEAYCRIRLLEEESKFKRFEGDILVDDTVELYQAKNLSAALNKFEKIVNKPFDYRGSISYTKKYQQAREKVRRKLDISNTGR